MLKRAHLIQQTTHRPHVRLRVVALMLQHLRTHIVRSARESRRHVHSPLQYPRYTKVSDFNNTILKEDIPGLQVPMEDTSGMHVIHGRQQLNGPVQDLFLT